MLRRFVQAAVATGAALGLVISVNPGIATADTPTVCWRFGSGEPCSGQARFKSYGDHLLVRDIHGHGTKAQMQKWIATGGAGIGHWENHSTPCYDDYGTGGADGEVDCNYNVTEGLYVRVHIWNADHPSYDSYSEIGTA